MEPKPKTAPQRKSRKADLAAWLEEHKPERIGEAEFARILESLAPVSESYLRRLLRESGVPLAPMVEGIRQDSLESLERTIFALHAEYERANPERRRAIRRLVIEAKDHAKLAERTHPEKHEVGLWLLTWLENPALFQDWLHLRKRSLYTQSSPNASA